jgi:hypothetical protein
MEVSLQEIVGASLSVMETVNPPFEQEAGPVGGVNLVTVQVTNVLPVLN